MIVDRRKDTYDELLVLARDAHTSRTRTNRWTTGLIVSVMTASAIYVATINTQIDELAEDKKAAENQVNELTFRLQAAERDRDIFRAQRDVFQENAGWFAEMASSSITGDSISNLGDNFPVSGTPRVQRETTLANVVWVVDGSRRFPMTANDILWIPESNLWVRLEDPVANAQVDPRTGEPYRRVTLHRNSIPSGRSSTGQPEFLGGAYRYYEEEGRWAEGAYGNADCLKLTLHHQSSRPAFAGNPAYVDLEVLLYNSGGSCPAGGRTVEIPPP